MIADLHLHTRLSLDAPQYEENNVSTLVKQANLLGIGYIAVTEHRDILPSDERLGIFNADLEECARQIEVEKRKKLENGRASAILLHGVELAHAHTHMNEAKSIISAHNYDFILGSLHVLKDGFDFYRMDYNDFSDTQIKEQFKKYLLELYDTASICDFDSLAHCTYPLRYIYRCGRLTHMCENPSEEYREEYAEIFKKLIERGKALEINTSGVRFNEFTNPSYDLLMLYKELGGKYVTVGSDSHDNVLLGSGIRVAEKMIAEAGFDGVTVYVSRQPRIIPFN